MKRLLTVTFITLALFSGALRLNTPVAHAAACTITTDCVGDPAGPSCVAGQCAAAATPPTAATTPPVPDNPVVNTGTGVSDQFGTLMTWIASLFAWLLGAGAVTLNWAVYYTVVSMGTYVKDISGIGITWTVLRDLGNIVLIFGFIAVGITTILNVNWYGGGKKMIPTLLIVAVFLNFSLFISEAVIDVGNLFATQFYTQIVGGTLPTQAEMTSMSPSTEGISNKIMNQLGFTSIYGQARSNKLILKGANAWLTGFMSIILFLIAAFVMFSLAFVLIARFVVLLFLIIIAPIGFAGLVVPKLDSTAQKWWSELFRQTITAPVLLLLLYIALSVITDAKFLMGTTQNWNGSTGGVDDSGFANILLSFLIAMGLLYAVVVVSRQMSTTAGNTVKKWMGAGASRIVRVGAYTTSLGGRAVFGSAGNYLASEKMQARARKNLLLRPVVLMGKGLRGAKYDFRNLPGAGTALGAAGINAGKGAKLTMRQVHEAQYGWKPTQEWLQHSEEERELAGRKVDYKKSQAAIEGEDTKLKAGTIDQATYDKNVEPHNQIITNALSKMSTKELEGLGGIKKGVDALVTNLSPQQFEALMKSDKLNDTEKNDIKDARYRTLTTALQNGDGAAVKKALGSYSKGELEAMPAAALSHPNKDLVLDQLTDKQRETIADSKERTASEKELVRNSSASGKIEATFNTNRGGTTGAAAVAPQIKNLTVTQASKLDKKILTEPLVAEQLSAAMLVELQEQKKLTSGEMQAIGNAIRSSSSASKQAKDYVTVGPGLYIW